MITSVTCKQGAVCTASTRNKKTDRKGYVIVTNPHSGVQVHCYCKWTDVLCKRRPTCTLQSTTSRYTSRKPMRRPVDVGSIDYRCRETVPTTVSLWSGEDVTRATHATMAPGSKPLSSGLLGACRVHVAITAWTTPTTGRQTRHLIYCYHYVHRDVVWEVHDITSDTWKYTRIIT